MKMKALQDKYSSFKLAIFKLLRYNIYKRRDLSLYLENELAKRRHFYARNVTKKY